MHILDSRMVMLNGRKEQIQVGKVINEARGQVLQVWLEMPRGDEVKRTERKW